MSVGRRYGAPCHLRLGVAMVRPLASRAACSLHLHSWRGNPNRGRATRNPTALGVDAAVPRLRPRAVRGSCGCPLRTRSVSACSLPRPMPAHAAHPACGVCLLSGPHVRAGEGGTRRAVPLAALLPGMGCVNYLWARPDDPRDQGSSDPSIPVAAASCADPGPTGFAGNTRSLR